MAASPLHVGETLDFRGVEEIVRQTAIFAPLGLLGLIYWYFLYPVHRPVFRGMLANLARAMG